MKQLLPEERLLVDDTAFAVAYRQIKLAKQFYGRFICHDDVRVSLRVLFKLASEILHVRLEGGDTQFIIFIVTQRLLNTGDIVNGRDVQILIKVEKGS